MEDVRRIILNAVRGAGVSVSPREVALATGIGRKMCGVVLRRLVRDLAVKRVGYGKYAAMRLSDLPQPRCIDELHPRHG